MNHQALQVIKQYYDSFNAWKMEAFFATMTEDVVHGINLGAEEVGKEPFRAFMQRMQPHYQEQVVDLEIFTNEAGTRAAAEFFVEGTYLKTDTGLPPARGQTYRLRCGAFFELREGKISRMTNYYNLQAWLSQIK